VARRSTYRAVAYGSTATAAATSATAQQQAATAQQQSATAQQQSATAQQQAAAAQQQAAAGQKPPAPAAAPAQAGTPAVGTIVKTLPAGCAQEAKGGVEYQRCGNVYYRAAFQGNSLVYVVQQP
jgi:biotin carboxyl carrier protein